MECSRHVCYVNVCLDHARSQETQKVTSSYILIFFYRNIRNSVWSSFHFSNPVWWLNNWPLVDKTTCFTDIPQTCRSEDGMCSNQICVIIPDITLQEDPVTERRTLNGFIYYLVKSYLRSCDDKVNLTSLCLRLLSSFSRTIILMTLNLLNVRMYTI